MNKEKYLIKYYNSKDTLVNTIIEGTNIMEVLLYVGSHLCKQSDIVHISKKKRKG